MQEFSLTFILISGVLTALAITGIWSKDRIEFFGTGKKAPKVKFRDYVSVLKGNRPLQMLVVSAATDKLAIQAGNNSTVMVMLYGIVMGNYGLYGKMSMITMIPSFIMILIGTKYASKFGSKKGFGPISGGIVIPMIADCADYETYLTGRYVPGMMGTLFSFVDKMISSFGTTIVGLAVAYIGYTSAMPQVGDAYTPGVFWVTVGLYIGMPMLGWIASLIAMKFYELDDEKMKEVQEKIAEIKLAAKEEYEALA